MPRWRSRLATTAVLVGFIAVGACAAEDPIEASGCVNGVPTDTDEALVTDEVLVKTVTECDNGRLVTFDEATSREAYRVAAELRGAEVLKSGELWLFLKED